MATIMGKGDECEEILGSAGGKGSYVGRQIFHEAENILSRAVAGNNPPHSWATVEKNPEYDPQTLPSQPKKNCGEGFLDYTNISKAQLNSESLLSNGVMCKMKELAPRTCKFFQTPNNQVEQQRQDHSSSESLAANIKLQDSSNIQSEVPFTYKSALDTRENRISKAEDSANTDNNKSSKILNLSTDFDRNVNCFSLALKSGFKENLDMECEDTFTGFAGRSQPHYTNQLLLNSNNNTSTLEKEPFAKDCSREIGKNFLDSSLLSNNNKSDSSETPERSKTTLDVPISLTRSNQLSEKKPNNGFQQQHEQEVELVKNCLESRLSGKPSGNPVGRPRLKNPHRSRLAILRKHCTPCRVIIQDFFKELHIDLVELSRNFPMKHIDNRNSPQKPDLLHDTDAITADTNHSTSNSSSSGCISSSRGISSDGGSSSSGDGGNGAEVAHNGEEEEEEGSGKKKPGRKCKRLADKATRTLTGDNDDVAIDGADGVVGCSKLKDSESGTHHGECVSNDEHQQQEPHKRIGVVAAGIQEEDEDVPLVSVRHSLQQEAQGNGTSTEKAGVCEDRKQEPGLSDPLGTPQPQTTSEKSPPPPPSQIVSPVHKCPGSAGFTAPACITAPKDRLTGKEDKPDVTTDSTTIATINNDNNTTTTNDDNNNTTIHDKTTTIYDKTTTAVTTKDTTITTDTTTTTINNNNTTTDTVTTTTAATTNTTTTILTSDKPLKRPVKGDDISSLSSSSSNPTTTPAPNATPLSLNTSTTTTTPSLNTTTTPSLNTTTTPSLNTTTTTTPSLNTTTTTTPTTNSADSNTSSATTIATITTTTTTTSPHNKEVVALVVEKREEKKHVSSLPPTPSSSSSSPSAPTSTNTTSTTITAPPTSTTNDTDSVSSSTSLPTTTTTSLTPVTTDTTTTSNTASSSSSPTPSPPTSSVSSPPPSLGQPPGCKYHQSPAPHHRLYKCKKCGLEAQCLSDLQRHLGGTHTEFCMIRCPYCRPCGQTKTELNSIEFEVLPSSGGGECDDEDDDDDDDDGDEMEEEEEENGCGVDEDEDSTLPTQLTTITADTAINTTTTVTANTAINTTTTITANTAAITTNITAASNTTSNAITTTTASTTTAAIAATTTAITTPTISDSTINTATITAITTTTDSTTTTAAITTTADSTTNTAAITATTKTTSTTNTAAITATTTAITTPTTIDSTTNITATTTDSTTNIAAITTTAAALSTAITTTSTIDSTTNSAAITTATSNTTTND
ncbi:hypothetical protein Ahia01_000500900, partial [Argonauta hians]